MRSRERLSVWFEGPKRIGVRRDLLPDLPGGSVQVRTRLAMVSTGTELAAWRGDLDPELVRDDAIPALAGGGFRFPFRYGYAALGEIERVGRDAEPEELLEGRVFAFAPHQTRFHADPADLLAVPPGLPDERAVRFPYCETAVNLLLDGPPLVGARVVVLGQGALGLALTGLLARFPLGDLATIEPRPARRELSRRFGARRSVAPEDAARLAGRADLVFEVSGSGRALDQGIRLAARDGTVVVGSWLARGNAELDLGGWFHRGRVRLVSSQVSRLPPLGPAWTRARRRELAWSLLEELPLEELPSLRVPFADAASAYAGLADAAALTATLIGGSGARGASQS